MVAARRTRRFLREFSRHPGQTGNMTADALALISVDPLVCHDPTVLRAATEESRLLPTLDRGFGDVRTESPGTHPGIVVMRLDDQRVPTVDRDGGDTRRSP
jgi:hypothetical protein